MATVSSTPIGINVVPMGMINKILLMTNGDSMVTKTIKGSELGTSGEVDLRPNPSYILSNSEGTLSAKFEKDDYFTDIKIKAEGTMFPIGYITSIDMENTDIDMNTTLFGVV